MEGQGRGSIVGNFYLFSRLSGVIQPNPPAISPGIREISLPSLPPWPYACRMAGTSMSSMCKISTGHAWIRVHSSLSSKPSGRRKRPFSCAYQPIDRHPQWPGRVNGRSLDSGCSSRAVPWRRIGGVPAAYMNESSSLRGLCLGLRNPLPGCLGSAGSFSCGKSKLQYAVRRLGTGRPTAAGGILQPGTTPISLFLPHGLGPPIGKLPVRCGFSPS